MEKTTIFRAYNPFNLFVRTLSNKQKNDAVLRAISEGRSSVEGMSYSEYESICHGLGDRALITYHDTKMGIIGEAITRKGQEHLDAGGDSAGFFVRLLRFFLGR